MDTDCIICYEKHDLVELKEIYGCNCVKPIHKKCYSGITGKHIVKCLMCHKCKPGVNNDDFAFEDFVFEEFVFDDEAPEPREFLVVSLGIAFVFVLGLLMAFLGDKYIFTPRENLRIEQDNSWKFEMQSRIDLVAKMRLETQELGLKMNESMCQTILMLKDVKKLLDEWNRLIDKKPEIPFIT